MPPNLRKRSAPAPSSDGEDANKKPSKKSMSTTTKAKTNPPSPSISLKVPSASKSAQSVKEKLSEVKDHRKKIQLVDAQANLSASRETHKKRLSGIFDGGSEFSALEDPEDDDNESSLGVGAEGDGTLDAKVAEANAAEAAEAAEVAEIIQQRIDYFEDMQGPSTPAYTTADANRTGADRLLDAVKKNMYDFGAQFANEKAIPINNNSSISVKMDVPFFRFFFGKRLMRGCEATYCSIITPDVYDEKTPVIVGEVCCEHILHCFEFEYVELKGHDKGAVCLYHSTVVFYPSSGHCVIHLSFETSDARWQHVEKIKHESEEEEN